MIQRLVSVIELTEFSNFAQKHLNEQEYHEIINYIDANPKDGDLYQSPFKLLMSSSFGILPLSLRFTKLIGLTACFPNVQS